MKTIDKSSGVKKNINIIDVAQQISEGTYKTELHGSAPKDSDDKKAGSLIKTTTKNKVISQGDGKHGFNDPISGGMPPGAAGGTSTTTSGGGGL